MATELKPDQWEKMTFEELLDQRTTLNSRYGYLLSQAKPEIAKSLIDGIQKLDAIINSKI